MSGAPIAAYVIRVGRAAPIRTRRREVQQARDEQRDTGDACSRTTDREHLTERAERG